MMKQFRQIIGEALETVDYKGAKDNERFRAAVQDLGQDYPKERKFILRNADDRFLEICSQAQGPESIDLDVIKRQAADYVRGEYMIEADFAQKMTDTIVSAFAHGKGSPAERTEWFDAPADTETVTAAEENEETETPQKQHSKGNKKLVIIVVIIALVVIAPLVLAAVIIKTDIGSITFDDSWQTISMEYTGDPTVCLDIPGDWSWDEQGAGLQREVRFWEEDSESDNSQEGWMYGSISYSGGEYAAERDQDWEEHWSDGIDGEIPDRAELQSSGSVEIDGETCSWFKWFENREDIDPGSDYGYALLIPLTGSGTTVQIVMYSEDMDELNSMSDQIVDTIVITEE